MAPLRALPSHRGSRRRVAWGLSATFLVAAITMALLTTVTPAHAATADFQCLGANGLGYSQGNTPTNLMAGKLTIPGFGVTTIGTGDIDFVGLNRGKDPTWQLWFNSLKWTEPLIASYAAGQRGSATYLNRAADIARDWVGTYPESTPGTLPGWNDQATSLRSETLACLAKYRSDAWLLAALDAHGRHLANARNYSGDWNHGLEQNIGLLAVSCLRDNAAWQQVAQDRAHRALVTTIDPQGVFNEQAPGYAPWTMTRWWTLDDVLLGCGLPSLPDLQARMAAMAEFLAAATQPDGKLVQIGDTYAESVRSDVASQFPHTLYASSLGTRGSPPAAARIVYSAGYVFSRSGWGLSRPFGSESLTTLRFGPRRYAHGHFDHGSLTMYARGQRQLVDAGHYGYAAGAYRSWLISPAAHNTLTVPGVPLRTYGVSTLTRSAVSAMGEFNEVSDDAGTSGGAYQGLVRTRGVYLLPNAAAMVILDRTNASKLRWMYTTKARTKVQWWHLDPSFSVAYASRSRITAVSPAGNQITVLAVPFPGETLPAGTLRAVRGATSPYQGWVSTAQGSRTPAVAVGRTTTTSRMLTVVVPAARGTAVAGSMRPFGTGWVLDLAIGAARYAVKVSAGGSLSR